MEFHCEGCGNHIFIAVEVPKHGLCAICQWCCEFIPAHEIIEMRRRLEPGGWISERTIRFAPVLQA